MREPEPSAALPAATPPTGGGPGLQAEGSVYRPHERTSRLRFGSPPAWVSAGGILLLAGVLPLLAFGLPPSNPPLPGLPASTLGAYLSGLLLFAVPGFVGSLLTTPVARALGGRFRPRRSLLLGLAGFALVAGILLLWRLLSLVAGPFSVRGPLLLGFGLTLWIRELTLVGVSHRSHVRSLPASLPYPLLGYAMVWALLSISPLSFVEGVLFLALALGGAAALITATDRPLSREFGQGGVGLLRPLMEHMSEREPLASKELESFFDRISTRGDLRITTLAFRDAPSGGRVRLAWVAPSVHPGPFADLGSSDLPRKVATALRGAHADDAMVFHAPSTHAQDIPTSGEVERVLAKVQELVAASAPPAAPRARASPLVRPRPGSLARAQVLGDTVVVLLTQAPAPTDDIDYALAEQIRQEALTQGFAHALILDAHNSFVENRGDVPFGSSEGFRLVEDAAAAIREARERTVEGVVRLGFAQRRGFNPEDHGMGSEGLAVAVVEAAGTRTAYALFDANNLLQGLRDPLVRALEEAVGGSGEVFTTDNHVVHEVQGGTNTLGQRRHLPALTSDLVEVAREAAGRLRPVAVGSAEEKMTGLRVLGPGVTTRLMTSLADSFAIFWLFFLASLALAALAGALLLVFLR